MDLYARIDKVAVQMFDHGGQVRRCESLSSCYTSHCSNTVRLIRPYMRFVTLTHNHHRSRTGRNRLQHGLNCS